MRITRPSIDIIEDLIEKAEYPSIVKEELFKYVEMQAKGLSLAEAFLRINPDYLGLSADDRAFAHASVDMRHQAFG